MKSPLPVNLKRYFLADIISQYGSGMSFIGLNWYILVKTGMNATVGMLVAIGIASGLLVLPITGPLIDRFNRKSILIGSNYVRALLISGVVLALVTQPFHIYYIYALAIINGIGWNIYFTCSRAFIQEIVPKEDLIRGNAIMEVSLQVGMFTAGATAGVLYNYCGIEIILLLNVLVFIVSGLILSRIKYENRLEKPEDGLFWQKFIRGYSYLAKQPLLIIFGVVMFLPFVATMTFNVVLPGYVEQSVKGGSMSFGLLDMCYGIGASLSGMVVLFMSRQFSRKTILVTLFLLSITAITTLMSNNVLLFACIATMLFGLPNSGIRVLLNTVAMELVEKKYMGRVMSVWNFIALVLQVVSTSIAGKIMDDGGPFLGWMFISFVMLVAFISYLGIAGRLHSSTVAA